jgi:hypothetical protein
VIRVLVVLAIATPAYADPDIRYSLGGVAATHDGPNGFGAGASIEVATVVAPSLSFVGHAGVSALWQRADMTDPAEQMVLPQLHAMFEYRAGPAAVAAGMGLDVFHSDDSVKSSILGFGANLRLAVDVVRDDRGTFAAIADVTRLPIGGFELGGWWGGDRGLTVVTLGCAFRPR